MARRKQEKDPLKALGQIANILESPAYLDDTTVNQRRAMREAADVIKDSIEEYGGTLTPPVLMAFWVGAMAQAHVAAKTNPVGRLLQGVLGQAAGEETSPHITINVSVAYLARDLLAGERVP